MHLLNTIDYRIVLNVANNRIISYHIAHYCGVNIRFATEYSWEYADTQPAVTTQKQPTDDNDYRVLTLSLVYSIYFVSFVIRFYTFCGIHSHLRTAYSFFPVNMSSFKHFCLLLLLNSAYASSCEYLYERFKLNNKIPFYIINQLYYSVISVGIKNVGLLMAEKI